MSAAKLVETAAKRLAAMAMCLKFMMVLFGVSRS
jgi:hypothetical protein